MQAVWTMERRLVAPKSRWGERLQGKYCRRQSHFQSHLQSCRQSRGCRRNNPLGFRVEGSYSAWLSPHSPVNCPMVHTGEALPPLLHQSLCPCLLLEDTKFLFPAQHASPGHCYLKPFFRLWSRMWCLGEEGTLYRKTRMPPFIWAREQ